MDSFALSQSFIGASITLTGRGGTSRHMKVEDVDDMDELPDSLVDKMYDELLAEKDSEPNRDSDHGKNTKTKAGNKSRKRKTIAPAASATAGKSVKPAQNKFTPNITAVGKNAKSRLFDYESEQKSASTIAK